jgi:hypothetical protein
MAPWTLSNRLQSVLTNGLLLSPVGSIVIVPLFQSLCPYPIPVYTYAPRPIYYAFSRLPTTLYR